MVVVQLGAIINSLYVSSGEEPQLCQHFDERQAEYDGFLELLMLRIIGGCISIMRIPETFGGEEFFNFATGIPESVADFLEIMLGQ